MFLSGFFFKASFGNRTVRGLLLDLLQIHGTKDYCVHNLACDLLWFDGCSLEILLAALILDQQTLQFLNVVCEKYSLHLKP